MSPIYPPQVILDDTPTALYWILMRNFPEAFCGFEDLFTCKEARVPSVRTQQMLWTESQAYI